MAALLVTLAIMAIMMSVAMPVWRQEARREKEAELVWRGEQYARAIALFRAKNQGNFPPSIDVLVSGRYLRKKYKDPLSKEKDGEFQIMPVGVATTAGPQPTPGQPQPPPQLQPQPQQGVSGIMGVRSKNPENSLRSYRGQTRYDQWAFRFDVVPIGRGAQPNANTPDGRGNPQGGRGPRGTGPGRGTPGQFNPPGAGNPAGSNPTFPGGRGTGPGRGAGRGPTVPGGTGRGVGRGPG
jgi:type II secretory pathway pseudopilin PulG